MNISHDFPVFFHYIFAVFLGVFFAIHSRTSGAGHSGKEKGSIPLQRKKLQRS